MLVARYDHIDYKEYTLYIGIFYWTISLPFFQIQKCKAQVLRKWLQENGLKCRSKDKKDDLARMVAVHIKQTGKTFNDASAKTS